MSEPILIALVQLFAIVAAFKHKQLSKNTRSIIKTYLKQYLNTQELDEYLLLYDELISFHELSSESDDWATEITLKKIQDICLRINKGLQQKDKIIIFIKFIEFIEEIKERIVEGEKEQKKNEFLFYKVVSAAFNLSENEYNVICNFLLNADVENERDNQTLIIGSEENIQNSSFKKIFRDRIDGTIHVIYLTSIDLFIGRYLGSDHIYLNGHFIIQNQTFIINPGSIIKSTKIDPIYYADIATQLLYVQQHINLQFTADNIGFSFKNSNNGIQPFSFTAESGELIGVMGASGAGKSTLLSLLNGSLNLEHGNIFINGHDLNEEKEKLKSIIGYIPQDDLLIEELTVFQNLYFNARLCYSNYSSFKLTRIILKVLTDVDLMEIRDLVVGSPLNKVISGGQRKRLNIALELIREPFVLFADEPTSGLSSMDSDMVMLLLKEQTLKGSLVMVNIHQPSSNIFKLFDKLLILDKGGYPIYYGNPIDSITYFKSVSKYVNPSESECLSCGYVNPEQLFQITEAKKINKYGKVTSQRTSLPNDWYKKFQKNIQPNLYSKVKNGPLPENNFKVPNRFKQFTIFSLRNSLIKLTNRQYILINLLEAPFLAFILAYLTRYSSSEAYVFGQNKNIIAYLFMSVVVSLFLGMMVSAEEIIKDRKLLKREAFLTLSWFSYLNSKVVFLFILSAIQALLFIVVGNSILGIKDMMLSYWLVLFSTSCFANMIGLNISSGLNSVVNIYILIPFFLVPQILLSGVIVPFNTLNKSISSNDKVPIVGDLMASRWAFEALAVNQFVKNEFSTNFYFYDKDISNNAYLSGYLIPAIQAKVDDCHRNIELKKDQEQTFQLLNIIKDEIVKLEEKAGFKTWEFLQFLTSDGLNNKTRLQTKSYLDSLGNHFSSQLKLSFALRDDVYKSLSSELGEEGVYNLKKTRYNQSLADWVLNKRFNEKIAFTNKRFVRKNDPVYMEPELNNGRAHFYAPVKIIGSVKIETLWFNVAVLWLMSLILYFLLWHNSLRKLLNYFEKTSKNKVKKQLKRPL